MIGIAFWNVYRKNDIDDSVRDLIIEKKCDILILAEYPNDVINLCNDLSLKNRDFSPVTRIGEGRIKILVDKALSVEVISDSAYMTINNFRYIDKQFMIAAVHLPSQMYGAEDSDQIALAHKLVEDIKEAEKRVGHDNMIVIGDFNANPFDKMCINADCFHAVPVAKEARKKTRTVKSYQYKMFYNPMWNFFGDLKEPAGTYFHKAGKVSEYFWNIFDQVIFRPQLLDAINRDSIEIVTEINGISLLTKNKIPDKKNFSDHLPIFFRMEEGKLYD